jgi:hypothetical protein
LLLFLQKKKNLLFLKKKKQKNFYVLVLARRHGFTRPLAFRHNEGMATLSARASAAAWLALLVFALLGLSFVTIERLKYAYLASRPALGPAFLAANLRPIDALFAAAACAAAAGLAFTEWRQRGLTRLLAESSDRALLLLLLLLLCWYGHAVLLPGLLSVGDSGSHVARVAHLMVALREGRFPYWDNAFFGGGLLLQNAGPVFHWAAAALGLALGGATLAVKLTAFAARLAAGAFMFAALRRAGLSRPAAFLGGLFFAGSYVASYMVSIRGTFPQIVQFAAFAALLACIETLLRDPRLFTRAWFGLCLAAIVMIGNHQPTAFMTAVLMAAYVAGRLPLAGGTRAIPALAATLPVIALGGLAFLLPFALEKPWSADAATSQSLITPFIPGWPALRGYLVWDSGGSGPVSNAYLGLPVLLLAPLGLFFCLRRRGAWTNLFAVAFALALATLFLAGPYVRSSVLTLGFGSIAAACAADAIVAATPRFPATATLILAIWALDTIAAPIQPFTRADFDGFVAQGQAIAARAQGQRVLEVRNDPHDGVVISLGPNSSPLHYAPVNMLYGPHKVDATKAHNAMVAALALAEADLRRTRALSAPVAALLAQYDVGWVVGMDGAHPGLPADFPDTVPDPAIGAYRRITGATPVLAASAIRVVPEPPAFTAPPLWTEDFAAAPPTANASSAERDDLALTAAMGIDFGQRTASTLLLPAPPGFAAPPPGPPPGITLRHFSVTQSRTRIALLSDRAGYLRIAHPWFRGIRVLRDGVPIPASQDVFSLLVVPLAAGESTYDITVEPSILRLACFRLSALTFAVCLCGFAWPGRRRGAAGLHRKRLFFF